MEVKCDELNYLLKKIRTLTGMEIFCQEKGQIVLAEKDNLLYESVTLRETLFKTAARQTTPVIYQGNQPIVLACISNTQYQIVLGPVQIEKIGLIMQRQFYKEHGVKRASEKNIPFLPVPKFLALLEMVTKLITGKSYTDEEIMEANRNFQFDSEKKLQEKCLIQTQDEEEIHHTYREEQRLLECIREGRTEEALLYNMEIDAETGKMSQNELRHWEKVTVVAITLCTRAAIEGGLSPAEAYRLSDYYLQKSDHCKDIFSMIACRNQAVQDLAEHVHRKRTKKSSSNYVEQCQDYIEKHYREKIYLDEIAGNLGISGTHLSKLFKKETGVLFQNYVNQFRVEKAANLLMYSEESLAYIAKYVNFPSQSYFGKIFKQIKNMTPREFREKYKPAEFHTKF